MKWLLAPQRITLQWNLRLKDWMKSDSWGMELVEALHQTSDLDKSQTSIPDILNVINFTNHHILLFSKIFVSTTMWYFHFMFYLIYFLTTICLPHWQIWAIIEEPASITPYYVLHFNDVNPRIIRSLVTRFGT